MNKKVSLFCFGALIILTLAYFVVVCLIPEQWQSPLGYSVVDKKRMKVLKPTHRISFNNSIILTSEDGDKDQVVKTPVNTNMTNVLPLALTVTAVNVIRNHSLGLRHTNKNNIAGSADAADFPVQIQMLSKLTGSSDGPGITKTGLIPASRKNVSAFPHQIHPAVLRRFETPGLRKSVAPSDVTSHRYSKYTIQDPKKKYRLCDRLYIRIEARDGRGRVKSVGGDYFRARIYNSDLKAGASSDGLVTDHNNGTYTATFTLRWPGLVFVQVRLVHSSEAVGVLRRVRDQYPSRCAYTGRFERRTGSRVIRETSPCNNMPPPHSQNASVCDFTDRRTKNPWFCIKPRHDSLRCQDYAWSTHNSDQTKKTARSIISTAESELFTFQKYPIKHTAERGVMVEMPPLTDSSWLAGCTGHALPACRPGAHLGKGNLSSGFFYKDNWYSNHCKLRYFKSPMVFRCLTNKTLYLHGDSTARQYYEYLIKKLGPYLKPDPPTKQPNWMVGPSVAYDEQHNFTLRYRHHGFPIRNNWTNVRDVQGIANALDSLDAGPDNVYMFPIWAHLTATNLSLYEHIVKGIRDAVERLHQRSPDTLVVLKSAHLRQHKGSEAAVISSDWFAKELDLKMRELFLDYDNIVFIDQWATMMGHSNQDCIHPQEIIISQGVRTLLSFICSAV